MSLVKVLKVLVVDDMSISRGLITQTLAQVGVQNIRYAEDGREALQKMREDPAHLVISDYNMPKMTGIELLYALRQNPKTQKVGFILITGKATRQILEEGVHLKMNNYLLKPFEPQDLLKKISEVFGPLS
ncbi:MAG: response regulator [Parvularculaceae bacterium]|nr:response regulator [Parvularculaceae bacterium]